MSAVIERPSMFPHRRLLCAMPVGAHHILLSILSRWPVAQQLRALAIHRYTIQSAAHTPIVREQAALVAHHDTKVIVIRLYIILGAIERVNHPHLPTPPHTAHVAHNAQQGFYTLRVPPVSGISLTASKASSDTNKSLGNVLFNNRSTAASASTSACVTAEPSRLVSTCRVDR